MYFCRFIKLKLKERLLCQKETVSTYASHT